jgi:membrane-associated phospholipid phosphatase
VIFAVLGLALAMKELPTLQGFLWAVLYGFWVSLAPILVVLYMMKIGRITDLHMNSTRERQIPYISSVIGAVIALALISFFDGPELLRCLALFSLIELAALAIITRFWLISIHATSIVAAAIISGLVFGVWAAIVLLPLIIIVCYVRIFLRRHTLAQVLAGSLLGVITVWLVTVLGCFS